MTWWFNNGEQWLSFATFGVTHDAVRNWRGGGLPVYLLMYLLLQREKWWVARLMDANGGVVSELLFNRLLSRAWPPALWPAVW